MSDAFDAASKPHSKDSSKETLYAGQQKRILEALDKRPDYTYTIGELFTDAGIEDHKLGHSILSRLAATGKVERLSRGVYRRKRMGNLAKSDPPLSFHGLHIALSSGAPSPRLVAALTAQDNGKTALDGKREIRVSLGTNREAIILISSSLEVRIACTDNPMSAETLYGILWALEGAYDLGFTKLPWQVVRIEGNKDHVGFTLDGASAVTVNLSDFMLKAYNRPGILREEIVLHRVPLNEF